MHVRHGTGIALAILALVFALLHFLASTFHLYFAWWWFDIVMHFLGGVLVGGFALWWVRFEVPLAIRPRVPLFATALGAIILVGVTWELFEYIFDIHAAKNNYTLDTLFDLLSGMVGAMSAYLVAKRL